MAANDLKYTCDSETLGNDLDKTSNDDTFRFVINLYFHDNIDLVIAVNLSFTFQTLPLRT